MSENHTTSQRTDEVRASKSIVSSYSDSRSKSSTVKPVLSSHSKDDNKMVLKTGSSLMQVESIADLHFATTCL